MEGGGTNLSGSITTQKGPREYIGKNSVGLGRLRGRRGVSHNGTQMGKRGKKSIRLWRLGKKNFHDGNGCARAKERSTTMRKEGDGLVAPTGGEGVLV